MAEKRKYDSTVARMAGNIAGAMAADMPFNDINIALVAERTVALARAIVAETERTEPKAE